MKCRECVLNACCVFCAVSVLCTKPWTLIENGEREGEREAGRGWGYAGLSSIVGVCRVLVSRARVLIDIFDVKRNFDDYVYVYLPLTGAHQRADIVLQSHYGIVDGKL